MSRDTIDVRECDRCKTMVEARGADSFEGWGSATATAQSGGETSGFKNADLCPVCFDLLVDWFSTIMRERDAERASAPRPERAVIPSIKEIAAKLVSDNLSQSPEMTVYFDRLDAIKTLDELQDYQAGNALILMRWLADPTMAEMVKEKHRTAYERLGGL